ncbi:hypothetical protein FHS29_007043 [Saccharothrix tamanrassetensis]|uniref:Uncharacterized protein n=1 Tax=Saccharothrix tamanrassetensis TaxID=1051531 RepID=A0A841CSZ5_9PSEU|nr:hypothetical protein [Saccharothrix tamanrassetensis]MBB5960419.1 hypothetical protein [Saccharothrix tamanrassetensis]
MEHLELAVQCVGQQALGESERVGGSGFAGGQVDLPDAGQGLPEAAVGVVHPLGGALQQFQRVLGQGDRRVREAAVGQFGHRVQRLVDVLEIAVGGAVVDVVGDLYGAFQAVADLAVVERAVGGGPGGDGEPGAQDAIGLRRGHHLVDQPLVVAAEQERAQPLVRQGFRERGAHLAASGQPRQRRRHAVLAEEALGAPRAGAPPAQAAPGHLQAHAVGAGAVHRAGHGRPVHADPPHPPLGQVLPAPLERLRVGQVPHSPFTHLDHGRPSSQHGDRSELGVLPVRVREEPELVGRLRWRDRTGEGIRLGGPAAG